jgi:hypothetical protein
LALAQDKLDFFGGGRRESVSPLWKDDTSSIELNRLYSKTKKQAAKS